MEFLTHPAAIHVPLALAILFPFIYGGTLWATMKKWLPEKFWYAVWCLAFTQIVSLLLAYSTGERSKVFSAAAAEQILEHERLGIVFSVGWLLILGLLTVVARTKSSLVRRVTHLFLTALLLGQVPLAIQLGKLGGALVMH